MGRYKLYIEYDGTNYSGWQKQPNANTIEEEIEKALTERFQRPVDIVGQGRTDAGVHAREQTAHVDLPELAGSKSCEKLLHAFLGLLPRDIAVWHIERVSDNFHARFDATTRSYSYQIVTRSSPLLNLYSERIFGDLNMSIMQECAEIVLGTHNFESFTPPETESSGKECTVSLSEFEFGQPLITYRITANRFVRHMVRRLIGTIIQVGLGKRSTGYFKDLLDNPSPSKNGHGASAKGLILENVQYENS